MRQMTEKEQEDQRAAEGIVRSCVSALRLSRLSSEYEDIAVALARLENWLDENDGRWVT